jgi:nickel/cobalt exporter
MRLALLFLLLCLGLAAPALADPFGHPAGADRPPVDDEAGSGPSLMGGMVQRLARAQYRLNSWVSDEIRLVRDTGSPLALLTVLGVAFLWGVLHAAGPGHGKSLVAAYLVTTDARWTSGMLLGGAISLLQGLTAIIAVVILAAFLHELQTKVRLQGAVIELVSYGLVALLGLVMLWRAVTGRGHAHHHGPLPVGAGGHAHDHHDHDHHGHDHHAHHHHGDHGHHDTAPGAAVRRGFGPGRILTLFAGVAPCASAIIIMLFSLANDALLIGVAAVLALSFGMGLTVAAIGVLSILARDFMRRFASGSTENGERLERLLAILGAVAVIGFSGLLALGAWDRLSAPI